MYTVTFASFSDPDPSVEWDEGFTAQSLGPGWLVVPALKIAYHAKNAQVISEVETIDHHMGSSVYFVSTWSTLMHVYFSLEEMPVNPPHAQWEGTQEFVFTNAEKWTYTMRGFWQPNALVSVVKDADGTFGKIVAQPIKT